MMKKVFFSSALAMACTLLCAGDPPPRPIPPHHRRGENMEHFRKGPGLWRAFSELSASERKEMAKLQRTDPEKFKEVMNQKVELIFKAEQAERQQLRLLAEQYKSAPDEKKPEIREKIKSIVRKRFDKRLNSNRRQLADMKRRAIILEQKLNEREENAEKIIDLQLEHVLSGKFPPPPHK